MDTHETLQGCGHGLIAEQYHVAHKGSGRAIHRKGQGEQEGCRSASSVRAGRYGQASSSGSRRRVFEDSEGRGDWKHAVFKTV